MVLVGSGPEMSVECRLVWIWGHGHCQAGDNETSKQERVNPRHHPGYLYTVRISPGPNAKQTPQLRASQGLGNANRCCPELPGNFSAVEIGHRLIPGVFSSLAFHQSTEVYIYISHFDTSLAKVVNAVKSHPIRTPSWGTSWYWPLLWKMWVKYADAIASVGEWRILFSKILIPCHIRRRKRHLYLQWTLRILISTDDK